MGLEVLNNLESKEVFRWFQEISKIPRESRNEKAISDYLVSFAKDRNLEVYQDKMYNVIIKKKGTLGYENKPALIIQGHTDMVCEKTSDSAHDFSKDPIDLIVEGDTLRANNTTLGADDGIAIAIAMALLDSNDIPHPPLELLATTVEETGMDGALVVTGEHLSGTTMINIDAEEEGVFLVSCAGGLTTLTEFDIKRELNNDDTYSIEVSNLKGGHSGIEIHNQRANAIKVLGRLLHSVRDNICLSKIYGGAKHNAIAKNAYALFTTKDFNSIKSTLDSLALNIKNEYRVEDLDILIKIEKVEKAKEVIVKNISDNIIDFMMLVPDGVLYMSRDIEGLVQTSANNGILKEENNKLEFTISIRSCVYSSLEEIKNIIETSAKRTNCSNFSIKSSYPAWEYDANSRIKDIAPDIYKKVTGKEAKIEAIHAGLECGILKRPLPNVDMISMGPNLYDVHTPNEHLSISSVDRVWKFLKELIINI